jgi:hypothetical protein
MNINILFIGTTLNKKHILLDESYDDVPDLVDENGNICENITDLEKNFTEYFTLIKNITNYDQVKYITIDPAYINENNHNCTDDPNYICHIPLLLKDISLDIYTDFFDCILITSTYYDMFSTININILNKILKQKSFLITSYPSGINELSHTFNKIDQIEFDKYNLLNLFIKIDK